MKTVKKLFPWSFKNETLKALIVTILVYMAVNIAGGVVFGLLSVIPLVGWIFSILNGLLAIYTLTGVVLASLSFFKVI